MASLKVLLFATAIQGFAREVGPIVLTVANLDRELGFFTNTLPFQWVSAESMNGVSLERLTGLKDAHARSVTLQLGEERIQLVEFLNPRGRGIPADSRSFDHWFQHIAIVVSDMDRAYERLREARVRHVSTSPQTLPSWNPNAGGIKAFYFRDPENHVLEIIWFPEGKGDPKWKKLGRSEATGSLSGLFLGIDHTAIVVEDTERSLSFYRDQLGLRLAGNAENWGVEQEHLNQVFGARLRITALRGDRGPGIELLEYLTPPGGRPLSPDAGVQDLLAWRIQVQGVGDIWKRPSWKTVGSTESAALVRDPDGHLLELRP